MDGVKALIGRGEAAVRQGRTVTHKEGKRRFARWLDEGVQQLQRGEGIEIPTSDEFFALAREKSAQTHKKAACDSGLLV